MVRTTRSGIEPGILIDDARLAFEDSGFVCPVEFGTPNELWCVMRRRGDGVQLCPVSPVYLSDDDREGVLCFPEPVISSSGKRLYILAGYTVNRWIQEIVPPGSLGLGTFWDRVLPDGLARAQKRTLIGIREDVAEPRCWLGERFVKGEILSGIPNPTWKQLTLQDCLNRLPEHDPPVPAHLDALARQEIDSWLKAEIQQRGQDFLAIQLF